MHRICQLSLNFERGDDEGAKKITQAPVLRSEEEKPTYFVLNSILVPRTSELRHNTVVDGCNLVQLSSSGMSGALPRLKRLIELSNHIFWRLALERGE
jgi:hypothetical protein